MSDVWTTDSASLQNMLEYGLRNSQRPINPTSGFSIAKRDSQELPKEIGEQNIGYTGIDLAFGEWKLSRLERALDHSVVSEQPRGDGKLWQLNFADKCAPFIWYNERKLTLIGESAVGREVGPAAFFGEQILSAYARDSNQ